MKEIKKERFAGVDLESLDVSKSGPIVEQQGIPEYELVTGVRLFITL